jgi:hypothetical protein
MPKGMIWALQGADSKEKFDDGMLKLAAHNKPAAEYLGKIGPTL